MRIDVKDNFVFLLTSLAGTKQATLIRLADSPDNLKTRLFRFTNALGEQATLLNETEVSLLFAA